MARHPISEELLIRKRNLPHWQIGGSMYFVSFRSLIELSEEARRFVCDSIAYLDRVKYYLDVAVVMQDHCHMLFTPQQTDMGWIDVATIMRSLKGYTARRINLVSGRSGSQLWQHESYDRIVRDEMEHKEKRRYILENPVRAGLCDAPGDYPYIVLGKDITWSDF